MGRGPEDEDEVLGSESDFSDLRDVALLEPEPDDAADFVAGTSYTESEISLLARTMLDGNGVSAGDTVALRLTHPAQAPIAEQLAVEAALRQANFEIIVPDAQEASAQVDDLVDRDALFISLSGGSPREASEEETEAAASAGYSGSAQPSAVSSKYKQGYKDSSVRWNVTHWPSEGWARRVYAAEIASGEMTPEQARRALAEDLMRFMRTHPDSTETWEEHMEKLEVRARTLNDFAPTEVSMSTPPQSETDPGTELVWAPAQGTRFLPVAWDTIGSGKHVCVNMPTEEIFTTPDPDSVRGRISTTRPMKIRQRDEHGEYVRGVPLMEVRDVVLEFEDGRITRAYCHSDPDNQEIQEQLNRTFIGTEYSRMGEIGLIAPDSQVAQSGRTYGVANIDEQFASHGGLGTSWEIARTDEARAADDKEALGHHPAGAGHMDLTFCNTESVVTIRNASGQSHDLIKDSVWTNP